MRLLLASLLALLAFAPAASGQAVSSKDVSFVKNLPVHFDSAGARLHGDRFYITTERDLTIYDVKDPKNPAKLGSMSFSNPGEPTFTEEDPDTNGKILLVSNAGVLMVIDVSDPTAPKEIGTTDVDGADQHTWTCVLDCTYGYGSEGRIADLRDPKNPKIAGDWRELYPAGSTHDLTEVSPGVLLAATEPIMFLDARRDPLKPALLWKHDPGHFIHQTQWPNQGTDDLVLTAGEAMGPACSDNKESVFTTWRHNAGKLTQLSEFRMTTGFLLDGRAPESTWCTHWFNTHPAYRNGGLVGIAWYEHGTRFLQVAPDGKITEVGHFLPLGGQASGLYWITPTVAYVADYLRGLDIIEFTGAIPPSGPPSAGSGTGTGTTMPATGGGTTTPTTAPRSNVPAPAPRFSEVVRTSCKKGRLTARAKGQRVAKVSLFRGAKRLAAGKKVASAKTRRTQRIRVLAALRDGTQVAAVMRGCR
jgi:hypothetical protein